VTLPDGELGPQDLPRVTSGFEETYRALYGRKGPDVALEVINWRVVASGPRLQMNVQLPRGAAKQSDARKGSRPAYFPEREGYADTAVYDRYALAPGMELIGPAIVEERESTLIVGPRGRARVDEKFNVIVELGDEK
jgi:N-methylhydantoinase A